jgi:polyketide synthase PksM
VKSRIKQLLRDYQAGLISEAEAKAQYDSLIGANKPLQSRPPMITDDASYKQARDRSVKSGKYQKVILDGPCMIEDIKIVEQDIGIPEEHCVQVQVMAFSLNFGDLLCVKGLYPTMPSYPFTPGFEAAGIVRAVGSRVERYAVGDEVIVMAGNKLGIQSTLITAEESQLIRKPPYLSFEEASSLLTVGLTVIEVFRRMRLAKNETILIQSATGGTGLIAVQMAQHIGARIIATASSDEKLQYLSAMGVPDVINYKTLDFEREVMTITKGKGVDAVINTLSGDSIQKGINCLNARGRYIEIAMTGLKSARNIDLSKMSNNQSFHSLDLRKLLLDDPEYGIDLGRELFSLVESNAIKVIIGKTFSFDNLKEAYRYLEARRNIGKVVITVPENVTEGGYRERQVIDVIPGANHLAGREQDLAIVGMSGRFGPAKNVDEFWQCLAEGRSLITGLPEGRKRLFGRLDLPKDWGANDYNQWGSYLEDIESFDPLFFNISGLEAQYMDPQQRIFLEESWKALEDAGLSRTELNGSRTGVIAGVVDGKYSSHIKRDEVGHSFWGTAVSILPARVAYFLNLKGPALAVDTACSSSLVAIHMGCQSLWNNETDLILAGGAFIQMTPHFGVAAGRAQMLSADGKCFTFDDRANGMISGEAVAVIVMKRLQDAVANGDHIYGVIIGSGINQDGATNGITAPSAVSQRQLELSVYKRFKIDPSEIQYVEAHGTGTKLGDPIEVHALTESFREYTDRRQYCAIGSVKTNVGHTVTAAGVVGVIKILLALKHKKIPASLNYSIPNRHIDFENSPFYVNTSLTPWTVGKNGRRRAAVSSFGFSGTNAHLVIEEYVAADEPKRFAANGQLPTVLVPISARSKEQLMVYVKNILSYLESMLAAENDHGVLPTLLADLAFTLQIGREPFEHRVIFLVNDAMTLKDKLTQFVSGEESITDCYRGTVRIIKPSDRLVSVPGNQNPEISNGVLSDDLRQRAERWVNGQTINWTALHRTYRPKKISLPTYPFAREQYWIGAAESSAQEVDQIRQNRPCDRRALESLLDDLLAQKMDVAAAAAQTKELLKGGRDNGSN